jgi:hypothetical protein
VYHNLEHVMSLFEFIRFATKAGVVLQDPAAVDWAVWFHDVVYDPRSDTNEADSAQLAGELLTAAGLPAATVDKVRFVGCRGACVPGSSVRPRQQKDKQRGGGSAGWAPQTLQLQLFRHPALLGQPVEGMLV